MRRGLGLLLVLTGALGACAGDGDERAGTTTSSTAEPTTTSTAEPTTTTTTPVPFDIEVRQAAIELLEIRNDVFMNPDVTRVSEYIADSCVCLERERGFIQRFVDDGVHWTAGPVDVMAVELTVADPAAPGLTLVVREPSADLITADGAVAQHVEELSSVGYRVTLLLVSPNDWRINGLTSVELNEETTAEVLAVGLP